MKYVVVKTLTENNPLRKSKGLITKFGLFTSGWEPNMIRGHKIIYQTKLFVGVKV